MMKCLTLWQTGNSRSQPRPPLYLLFSTPTHTTCTVFLSSANSFLINTCSQGSEGPGLERLITASRTRRVQPGSWKRGWVPLHHRSKSGNNSTRHQAARHPASVPTPPPPPPILMTSLIYSPYVKHGNSCL